MSSSPTPGEAGANRFPEYSLPFVIHLLAYHRDFDLADVGVLPTFQHYLEFYFEHMCYGHEESFPLLQSIVQNLKLMKSRPDPAKTEVWWD